jgi:hypothetical protein
MMMAVQTADATNDSRKKKQRIEISEGTKKGGVDDYY